MAASSPQVRKTDVLISGSGSAGLCAAVWLARLGIDFIMVDKRDGPLKIGQADGVQCRTVEIFESLGLRDELVNDAYWVTEVCFWGVDETTTSTIATNGQHTHGVGNGTSDHTIKRLGRTADVQPGLSWQPHVIMNQAHLNALFLSDINKHGVGHIEYNRQVTEVKSEANRKDYRDYPVSVMAQDTVSGDNVEFRAKYVLACDGAHSAVRRSLGYRMIGDSTDSVWGVMDIYPLTNFPDIRKKATLRTPAGNLLIIPREGGSMVRFYLELPFGTVAKEVKLEDLQSAARKIFATGGFEIQFADTFWWSAYTIGQRLAERFVDESGRIFLMGDACHTHSPKAGQGMNASLQDGFNIGWKLASALKGQAKDAEGLLETYVLERQKTAAELIAFDREWARLFSSKKASGQNEKKQQEQEHQQEQEQGRESSKISKAKSFEEAFVIGGTYTAGLSTCYADSVITSSRRSAQELAKNVLVGMRFPSAQVVRICDAKAMQLAGALLSTGPWRIVVFAGDILQGGAYERLLKLSTYLSSPASPIRRFTQSNTAINSLIEPLLVLSGNRIALDDQKVQIPSIFQPVSGKRNLPDVNKTFIDDHSYNHGHGHLYSTFGIDPKVGAVVIVRPDLYVSLVTSVEDHEGIGKFFEGFCTPVN